MRSFLLFSLVTVFSVSASCKERNTFSESKAQAAAGDSPATLFVTCDKLTAADGTAPSSRNNATKKMKNGVVMVYAKQVGQTLRGYVVDVGPGLLYEAGIELGSETKFSFSNGDEASVLTVAQDQSGQITTTNTVAQTNNTTFLNCKSN